MSIDVWIAVKLCDECARATGQTYLELPNDRGRAIEGCTHNLAPMWREAGVYEALYESDGTLARAWLDVLRVGRDAMEADPARFRKLNPPNGWGDFEGAFAVLEKWLRHCEQYPNGTIRGSR